MGFFCLLWVPLFYLFWRSIKGQGEFSWGVVALIAGSVVAMLQFLFGSIIEPVGFELSRWMSAFIDIVAMPVIVPLLLYFLLSLNKILDNSTDSVDFAGFALLWLIPSGAIRAVSWSVQSDPIQLVLVPLLWTAIAVGVPFLVSFYRYRQIFVIIPAFLGALFVPFAATYAYWAFFAQLTLWGYIFLVAAMAPMLVTIVFAFLRGAR